MAALAGRRAGTAMIRSCTVSLQWMDQATHARPAGAREALTRATLAQAIFAIVLATGPDDHVGRAPAQCVFRERGRDHSHARHGDDRRGRVRRALRTHGAREYDAAPWRLDGAIDLRAQLGQ